MLDGVIGDAQSSPAAKRKAYLATAMIRIDDERKVRDVGAARAALQNAAALDVQAGPDALTRYFANAIDQVLDIQEHALKSQSYARQLARDKATLQAQNKQLAADKAKLNAALEKLKQVTLGN